MIVMKGSRVEGEVEVEPWKTENRICPDREKTPQVCDREHPRPETAEKRDAIVS